MKTWFNSFKTFLSLFHQAQNVKQPVTGGMSWKEIWQPIMKKWNHKEEVSSNSFYLSVQVDIYLVT